MTPIFGFSVGSFWFSKVLNENCCSSPAKNKKSSSIANVSPGQTRFPEKEIHLNSNYHVIFFSLLEFVKAFYQLKMVGIRHIS